MTIDLRKLLLFTATFSLNIAIVAAAGISRESYIDRYKEIAIEHQKRYGIPASITIAQGILESANGNSELAKKSNNHFGIKCNNGWRGPGVSHEDDARGECFRAYSSVEQSYDDHAKFLSGSARYSSLFKLSPTDYRGWARGLKAAGYATAHDYAHRLIKLIEENKLYALDKRAPKRPVVVPEVELPEVKPAPEVKVFSDFDDVKNYRVPIRSYRGYGLYRTNKTRHIIADEGDSCREIAEKLKISTKKIAKYNELSSEGVIFAEGDVIYIGKKQSRWNGAMASHRVARGETLRSIAQHYGITQRGLRKLNNMKRKESTIFEGQEIRLK